MLMQSNMFLKKALALPMAAGLVLFIASCTPTTGPMGPGGANGTNGISGIDGAPGVGANCSQCHDSDSDIKTKIVQYNDSKHNTGSAYIAEGVIASCSRCHSDQGHQMWQAAGRPNGVTQPSYAVAQSIQINCRTCHKIHSTYTASDYTLRSEAAVTFTATATITFDKGRGNVCVSCHNPRRIFVAGATNSGTYYSSGSGAGTVTQYTNFTSTISDPHYGTQPMILAGTALATGFQFTNMDWTTGIPNGHYNQVADSCVGCHMRTTNNVSGSGRAANPGHSLAMTNKETGVAQTTVCKSCHADIGSTFDYHMTQTTITNLMATLSNWLVTNWVMTTANALQMTNTFLYITNWGFQGFAGTNTPLVASNWAIFTNGAKFQSNTNRIDAWGYLNTNAYATTNGKGSLPVGRVAAWENYRTILNDGSKGVHNYPYTLRLLQSSLLAVTNLNGY
ncbi:MAG: cytochrome c3 family protein [Spirochaetes bacterium]|nr:cytochrome c3 family protein [Spirochaetota bacterium]